MNLLCYACAQPHDERRGTIAKVDDKFKNFCWGICGGCGLVVCAEHGFRHSGLLEYQCVYCVGPGMRRWWYKGISPDGPVSPPGNFEEFTYVYSSLKTEVMEPVKKAILGYLDEMGLPNDASLDAEALSRAAVAFEKATGAVQQRVASGEFTEA